MEKNFDSQYFLIIPELKIFPELSNNIVVMIEQIMNGVLLCSQHNIQEALNRVITLEVTCKKIITEDYKSVIAAISPLIQTFGLSIVDSHTGHSYIINNYNDRRKYFASKLVEINHEFSLLKKISYDGNVITFENTFINWVYDLVNYQHTFITHNPEDKFMSEQLFPELTNHIQASIDTIEEHTKNYADQLRQSLIFKQANAS